MTDREELRRRFEQVGWRKARAPWTAPEADASPGGLPAGEEIATDRGPAYRLEKVYPADHEHGRWPLHAALSYEPRLAAAVAQVPGTELDPRRLVYLDTETTGLAGGAGTLVFLVGIGRFVDGGFRLRQYFLRDPAEEPAMLLALHEELDRAHGFVTFNGQAFDLPLLEMRFTAGLRRRLSLSQRPQLDLLFPARRLWRHSLPDCTLTTLEASLLGVRRAEDDVPGFEIPGMYLDYLRSGATEGIRRIVYHNLQDVLTLVGLATQVLDRHAIDAAGLAGAEAVGLARWHDRGGRAEEAEACYRSALESPAPWLRREALAGLTTLLKRSGRRAEAVPGWEAWLRLAPDDPSPAIELAKFYEWERRDPSRALRWAEAALESLSGWPRDWRRRSAEQSIRHRMTRLRGKRRDG